MNIMGPPTERLQQVAEMYARHDEELHHLVGRRGSNDTQIVDDACAYAWTELLAAEHVDLRPPRWQALAWLTTCALREAWRLGSIRRRDVLADHARIIQLADHHSRGSVGVDELVAQRARLALIRELPERPRRFLLRQMLGYTYAEIAEQEGVTLTSTNKQIARAKRLLRQLEAQHNTAGG